MRTFMQCIHHSVIHLFKSIQPADKAVEYLTDSYKLLTLIENNNKNSNNNTHNTTQHNTTQHNTTQHNTTQHNTHTHTHTQAVGKSRGLGRTEWMGVETRSQMRSKHINGLKERYLLGQKSANFWGNPLCQATKRHLNNS